MRSNKGGSFDEHVDPATGRAGLPTPAAALAVGVGVLLLLFWAFKHLSPSQLKRWGLILLVGGFAVCLLTLGAATQSWPGMTYKYGNLSMMKDGRMKGYMMNRDDMMQMSMTDMSAALKGKTGDDFDKAFIEGMIPHHQGAIEMAKLAQTSAKHEEIKEMAEDIIAAQQMEIDMMKEWQEAWGY